MTPTPPEIQRVRDWLATAARVTVLTGAGISAESGVPTFRGKDGLWQGFRATDLATPEAFGFVNTTSQCILDFEACAASGFRYLFWDGVHPTTYAHAILGDLFARAVPEPATLVLVLAGIALLARRHGRRALAG